MSYPVDMQAQGFAPIGQTKGSDRGPSNIFVNSAGDRIVFAWTDSWSYSHLGAARSTDRGLTWAEVDAANAINQLSRYARVCAHPTDVNKVCVAYSHVIDTSSPGASEIYVKTFDLETLTWGTEYGGLMPVGFRRSVSLEGICARAVAGDLVVLALYYETAATRFRMAFFPLSLSTGWGTPVNCADVDPLATYGSQLAPADTHGVVADGLDDCHALVQTDLQFPAPPSARWQLHHSILSGASASASLLHAETGFGQYYVGSLVWHSLGYLYAFVWQADESVSHAGFCADGGPLALSLSSIAGTDPRAYVDGAKVYVFSYCVPYQPAPQYLTYDAATGTPSALAGVTTLFPSWYAGAADFLRSVPAVVAGGLRLAAIFNRQYYHEVEDGSEFVGASYLAMP
jgi:hypothetical protein